MLYVLTITDKKHWLCEMRNFIKKQTILYDIS